MADVRDQIAKELAALPRSEWVAFARTVRLLTPEDVAEIFRRAEVLCG